MKQRQWGLLGLVLSFVLVGCGSSGGNGSAETQASCNAYCTAYIAAACASPIYATAAECNTNECAQIPASAPAKCQMALKTYYDCRKAQADICGDAGCDPQATAYISACQ